jgi:branched-chain amino acid transport system substrate-binding protein
MRKQTSTAEGTGGRRPGRGSAVVFAGLLLFAIVGCSSDDDATDTNTTGTTAAQSSEDLLGPENQATGEPVRVGMVSDGRTDAYDNTDELRAAQAAAEYFNAHQGGLGGRPVEVVTCQAKGDPAGAADCANQMVEEGVVAVAASQSAVAQSLWEPLHAAGIPILLGAGFGETMQTDTQSTFLLANPVATFFGLPVAAAKAEGAEKIAFVVIDVPQAVDLLESPEGEATLQKSGLEYEVVRVPVGTADMTTQMQEVVNSGAKVVHVLGNDAFCIAAFQGLNAVAYDGTITAVNQCLTNATREALPGGLEGISVLSTVAVGATGDPTYELYLAVIGAYGTDVTDPDNFVAMGGYNAMASLLTAAASVSGDITPQSMAAAVKAMPESVIAGGGGAMFQCGGSAYPTQPAVCTNQWLRAELDADGNPSTYSVEDSTDLLP